MADPGFPVGGGGGGAPIRSGGGGTNLRHVHFLAQMYAKMKEIDTVGGGGARRGASPWIRQCIYYGHVHIYIKYEASVPRRAVQC